MVPSADLELSAAPFQTANASSSHANFLHCLYGAVHSAVPLSKAVQALDKNLLPASEHVGAVHQTVCPEDTFLSLVVSGTTVDDCDFLMRDRIKSGDTPPPRKLP